MGRRLPRITCAGSLALAAGVSLAFASPAEPVFAIPGLAAKRITVGGVARLDDGGAVIAAALDGGARLPAWRPVAVRLRLDGTVDLAYGSHGTSRPRLGADSRPTALAVDPASGDSWIGIAAGRSGRGEIIALDGRGRRRSGFGAHGTLKLPEASSGPVALGWDHNQLLVADGTEPCVGCAVSILNATTGRLEHMGRVTAAYSTGCSVTAITSAAFLGSGRAVLGTRVRGGADCAGDAVALITSAPGTSRSTRLPDSADQVVVSGSPGEVCVAESGRTGTRLGPLPSQRSLAPPSSERLSRAPAGHVVSVVPLGNGACAALISTRGYPAPLVLQAPAGQRLAISDALPTHIAPLGMFRCHHHLLAIGDRAQGTGRGAVVVVLPVRAGPAALAGAAAAATGSRRCTT